MGHSEGKQLSFLSTPRPRRFSGNSAVTISKIVLGIRRISCSEGAVQTLEKGQRAVIGYTVETQDVIGWSGP